MDKNMKKSKEDEVLPRSIENMPGFTAKIKVKDAKLLHRTAALTLAIEEGIPFWTLYKPSFL
jgi:hypothetical protein